MFMAAYVRRTNPFYVLLPAQASFSSLACVPLRSRLLALPAAAPAPKVVPNARAAANVRLTGLGAPARDDPLLGDATLFQRGTFTWALP